MGNVNRNRFSGALLGFAVSGFLVGSIGCDAAPSPEAVDIARLGAGHADLRRRQEEILDCCRQRVEPRRRAECEIEALHDRGVCALLRPGHHPDAGTRDASPDSSLGEDGGSGACGLVIQSITPSENIFLNAVVPLNAVITDPNPDAALTFEWTTPLGTFFPADDPAIGFICSDLGSSTYTLTVSDGVCQTSASTVITCVTGCGDSIIEPGEQCDPPQNQVCSSTCQNVPAVCGDGIIQAGEECDPPDLPFIPGLSGQCGPNCDIVACGNGIVDPGEQCDPPQDQVCDATCQNVPAVCGDGVVQAGEQCDPPEILIPGEAGQCGPDCQFTVCGNDIIDPGEQCDPPNVGGDGLQCSVDCHLLTCGNGVIDAGEQCDPPESGFCSSTCQTLSAVCGDGIVEAGEQCDPPQAAPGPGQCGPDCQLPLCGNNQIDPGEQCDPPRTGICSSTCQNVPAVCGDGVIQAGEQCDPPQASPPATGRQCGPDCQFSPCGNGQIDPGEQCDPPRPGFCSSTCQNVPAVCGDGVIQAGEQCDPPKTGPSGFQCGPNCQFLTCGNGIIDPGEQCDPPRASNPPGITSTLCSQTCQNEVCGNGIIDPGEQCDPPDGVICNSLCQATLATCGNGAVDPNEQCDFPDPQYCLECELTTCGACFFGSLNSFHQGANTDPVCSVLSGADRTNCLALLDCMSAGGGICIVGEPFNPGTACYCSDSTCSTGVNGRCVAQVNAVVGSTDLATVLAQLSSATTLVARVRAEATLFANSGCGAQCSGIDE
jgi:hypothetical protein